MANVNVEAPGAGLSVSLPLASTSPDEDNPVIVPPTECARGAQATATVVTLAPATVPVEFVRLQCSPVGCVCTVTM